MKLPDEWRHIEVLLAPGLGLRLLAARPSRQLVELDPLNGLEKSARPSWIEPMATHSDLVSSLRLEDRVLRHAGNDEHGDDLSVDESLNLIFGPNALGNIEAGFFFDLVRIRSKVRMVSHGVDIPLG